MRKKSMFLFILLAAMLLPMAFAGTGSAAPVGEGKKILFVPLDNRPITDKETWQVAAKLGYEMVVPPDTLLGTREQKGDPEGLWAWLQENAPGADAAVVSTDAMIYGSLVASRTHELDREAIAGRVQKFRELHEKFPRMPIYAFGTILRTLLTATHSGSGMETEEYQRNAVKIYHYSILRDKLDMGLISEKRGKRDLEKLEKDISPSVLASWEERHLLNYGANQSLMDLARQNVFAFLYLGADDSAPLSQTHYEFRHLRDYGKDLGNTRFQITSGSDELAMVMLCRAVSSDLGDIPFVYAAYNEGKGRDTIPSYSLEKIGTDVDGIIVAAGGMQVSSPDRAEIVIAVNTNPNGKTTAANLPSNTIRPRKGTKQFVSLVKGFLDKGYPVAVGDIAMSNGSDNALMEQFRKEGLQFRLRAYGGWNTATNTVGFLIGTGILSKWMDKKDAEELMLIRYLDDWAYQANVRQQVANALPSLPGDLDQEGNLAGKRAAAEERGSLWMREFAAKNIQLPQGFSLESLRITYPWNRLFECDIFF